MEVAEAAATTNVTALVVTILATIVGSSGLFALIQFLISRNDKKNDKIKELQKFIEDLGKTLEERDEKFHASIDTLSAKIDKSNVVQARIRILRANDEIRQGSHHSYEYFRQIHQDITEYEQYCKDHPEFKNNEAVNSIEYINRVYQDCLNNNSFLT